MDNGFDDIFNNTPNEEVEILEIEEKPPKKKFKLDFNVQKDKVLFVQLLLIGIWVILTVLIYFFGYNLFEPFINV